MKLRNLSLLVLLLGSNFAHAQIVIGAPVQEVPVLGAPLLVLLGGVLAYVAYKFKSLGRGKLHTGLMTFGALTLIATGSGISLIEKGVASGTLVGITATGDTSYTINASDINTFQNNTGITLEVKSIQLPGTCTNADLAVPPANTVKCAVNLSIQATHSCYIRCN
ncbi:midcut-by-XrtH protein [Pseudoteredinibacter isoporae]|uniref:Midcut-by-XrtH protein n=1 Tax=Pseudoteredinibacter isoporae TaxID=570281 RepID=A0A7X0MTV5_9GAMM|nr:midcut-by-XrtH protein [Pseudoteredinibacter isoporae]MBB6519946.1 hypothetical protein [Pseudoteredinibacter isoporae]NHO85521.1 midcut-by-XrtH protein [Pseudoteredinibacter isoporae]NIB26027.1 midcut-by-XrtH protein [Pseudoteredinibacter isoporae]